VRLSSDGDFDLDAGFDVDDDLLDNFGWGVKTGVGVSNFSFLFW